MQSKSTFPITIGRVSINYRIDRDSVYLDWYFNSDRYRQAIGKLSSDGILKAARATAQLIDSDITFNQFDPTLAKYFPGKVKKVTQLPTAQTELNLAQVWELYKKARLGDIAKSTLDDALAIGDNAIKALSATDLLPEKSSSLYDAIKKAIPTWKSDTGSIYVALKYFQFASNLAASEKNKSPDIKYNYWGNILSQIPKKNESIQLHLVADIKGEGKTLCYEDHGKKRPKCFTQDEIKAILDAINSNEFMDKSSAFNHDFYYHYVRFLAMTGMRPGEALALSWGDIKIDRENNGKESILIWKSYHRNRYFKETKTGETRMFPINKQLRDLLDSMPKYNLTIDLKFWHNAINSVDYQLVNPLFFGQKLESIISQHDFTNRVWTPVVKGLVATGKVKEYLPPYHLRHTFITNMCRQGIDLATIAGRCGNSAEVILAHYYASDDSVDVPKFDF